MNREFSPEVVAELRDALTQMAGRVEPSREQVRMPCPEGLDPDKWAQLDRRTRRALVRHHRKVTR